MSSNEEGAASGGLTGWPLSEYRKRKLEIRFTGSGSEYFRIWIINLLLTAVTLSLYWPFAKARRLQYFYANTLVDGQALSFHGNPWKMFRGHVLLMVLAGTYSMAGHVSVLAGVVAFLVMCAIWPALWRAGQQFRLSNTSWRGLRFGFDAPLQGAYAAVAPLYLPLIVFVGLQAWLLKPGELPAQASPLVGGAILLNMLVVVALLPVFLAMVKRYQHNGYRYAEQDGELDLSIKRVYVLSLKALGLFLLIVIALGIGFAVLVSKLRGFGAQSIAESNGETATWVALLSLVPIILTWLLMLLLLIPYFTARFQNLLWNHTTTQDLTFTSHVTARAMIGLTVKNAVLSLVTLGLYRPWAAVQTAQLRLEAVSVTLEGDLDTWLARQQTPETAAAGDLAGDFFGIDMGL